MDPIIVEFIGKPGSGKTTTANKLIEMLEKHGYKCNKINYNKKRSNKFVSIDILDNFLFFAFLAFKYYSFFFYIIKFIIENFKNPMSQKKQTIYLLKEIYLIETLLNKSMDADYDFLILDQGFLQSLWSVSIYNNKNNIFYDNALKNFELIIPDILIYIDISNEIVFERMKNRDGYFSRFDCMDRKEIFNLLNENEQFFTDLIEKSKNIKNFNLITLNGLKSINSNCNKLFEIIK
ncbi:AAA family ATPase [Halanaerobium sp. Z-7514]|uniref:AAA family ATPase n=1 Tax=Halanaerobium polyolivorans TaxID=2886943 RepID=A0AAW4X1H3_9FIRM|nr:AAA family ATPase [Halanaerobium polyolivorans]MCC3145666.1 AAA family ATPase [Halanaerobium polyolivorans]